MANQEEPLNILEAMLFAATEPLDEATLLSKLPEGTNLKDLLEELCQHYSTRGINLVKIGKKWAFRTSPKIGDSLKIEIESLRKLSQACLETLAIIAYYQPITRAEIEEIRGKVSSRGTLDILLEESWVQPKGKRRTPGRPPTWGTTENFLDHFHLSSVKDLPGLEELKASGLHDAKPAINAYEKLSKEKLLGLGLNAEKEKNLKVNHNDGDDKKEAIKKIGTVA